jgi:uncharacterized protein YbjQ (UPF0145 family)
MRVTTLETIAGRSIEDTLGIVRGSSLWARRVNKNSTAGHRALEHMSMDEMAEGLATVRAKAEAAMQKNAAAMGADSIIGMKFELVEVGCEMYQAIAYGTAVISEALPQATPAFAAQATAVEAMGHTFGAIANDADAVVVPFRPRRAAMASASMH